MKKRLVYASLLAIVLLGASGCRIPLLDPPIVGRWLLESGNVNMTYAAEDIVAHIIFERDKTGFRELSSNGEVERSGFRFHWSYNRVAKTLMLGDTEIWHVKYNLLRTRATLYDPEYPQHTVTLRLDSTPLLRL